VHVHLVLVKLFQSFANKLKGRKKMNIQRKVLAASILILLMSSIALMQTSIPSAEAQLASQQPVSGPLPSGVTADATIQTIAHLSFRPRPIGLGQPLLVNIWMQPPISAVRQFTQAFTVTITKPDGTKEVIGPMDSYLGDGTAWFEYTPDQVGKWTIKFDFLGMYYPAGRYYNGYIVTNSSGTQFTLSSYYQPSSNGPFDLIVQENQVASWPPSSLPTDYWTRPVAPHNREWWSILGNWPSTGVVGGGADWPANTNKYNVYNGGTMNNYYAAYVKAPNTAHVVWKRQFALGGLIGGTMGQQSIGESGTVIYGHPTIICMGRAFQMVTKAFDGVLQSVWQSYDIRTGEVYWELTGITQPPTFITYDPGGYGGESNAAAQPFTARVFLGYIGNGRLITYRPWNGAVVGNYSIAPLTTGVFYADPYVLSVQNLGNSVPADQRYRLINWTTKGTLANLTTNTDTRIVSNISWPFSNLGNVADFETGIAVSTASVIPTATQVAAELQIRAASLTTGQLLWNVTSGVNTGQFPDQLADHGKYATRFNDGYWYCWDLNTGKELWKSELSSWPWGTFGTYGTTSYGGMIISSQFDCICGIDWNTGKIVWKFESENYPYETPYTGSNGTTVGSWHSVACVADGKIYDMNAEHSPDQPLKRGWKLHCINATTGEGIWNITSTQAGGGDGSRVFQGAIADGYLAISNAYDATEYVFGKGKSATTVEGPKTAITLGQSVVITGTVLDQSPGQPGTPCVSKESMTTQMEYLHMQYPIDGIAHNFTMTGVPVTLTAIDQNGNPTNIGTATTSAYYGTFELAWTPPAEGTYKIIAAFAGDDSYGSSGASTAVLVGPAEQQIVIPEQATPPDNTMMILGVGIAVIIAVALVGVILYRKK
jgi:hypothetical protein